MHRSRVRRAVIVAAASWLVAGAMAIPVFGTAGRSAAARQDARLNVLVLLADDQRYNTIAALGHPDVRTPNLDRLVRRGTAFTRAHIMGALQPAVGAPSRAMLLTGRGLFGLRDMGSVIPPEHGMFPEAFRRAGYTTFATGKWHNDRQAFARAWTSGGAIFFGGIVGGARRTQLFNLAADPWEMKDLSDDAASQARVGSMRERLRRALREAGDPLHDRLASARSAAPDASAPRGRS